MKMKFVVVILTVISPLMAILQKDYEDFPEAKYMNLSVNPCEDFYEYTCGNFKNIYPLEDGDLTIDHFTLLERELTKLASLILSEPDYADDPQALKKTKSAYKACLDLDYLTYVKNPELTIVNAEKGFPLVQLKYYQAMTNYSILDVADAVSNYGISMLFNVQAYANVGNASNTLIYIYRTSDILPVQIRSSYDLNYEQIIEEAFSSKREEKNAKQSSLLPFDIFLRSMALKIRNAAQSQVTDDEVFENIDAMVKFIRGVSTGGYVDNATILDINGSGPYSASLKDLNDWTQRQFQDTFKLDWVEFFQRLFANSGIQITEDTQVMKYEGLETLLYGILNMVKVTEDHVVKSFVMMRIFTFLSLESDDESRGYIEDYFKSTNVKILPRWKYCTRKFIDATGTAGLSFATAYEYQLRHFNVDKLAEALQLIQDLRESFQEIIQDTTWMDDDTKNVAVKKFNNMITIMGHPDISFDRDHLDKFYENLKICKWDNYGNSLRIRAFKNAYQISQVGERKRPFWEKSPFEVNAYYNRPNNKIIFPIAMLHSVFFGNPNSILDYGRIGSVIGHEMTHGFDSDGMMYDPNGVLDSWWTQETKTAFTSRTECFVDEYDHFYEPEIESFVNGTTTLNENIADNGGAREAYRAMKKMLNRTNILTEVEDFTPEQLFFIGYGTMWCNNPSVTYLKAMSKNEHSRSKYRVNGVVSNMEEFAEAFNCPLGSNMNPVKKCRLW